MGNAGQGINDHDKATQYLYELAIKLLELGGSDIFITAGSAPALKVNQDVHRLGERRLTPQQTSLLVRSIMNDRQAREFDREHEVNFSLNFPDVARFRVSAFTQRGSAGMVLRLIPQTIPTIEELHLPEVLKTLSERPKGMMLVTGPTGSGKSTTLAAIIDHINRTMKRHILTIEDPIEFVHQSRESLIRQREVGAHTKLFKAALRAALREDPDVILIGEIRDQETLTTAIEASQTGHLVFGTLHTNSAVRTVERVLGMYPPQEQDSVRRAVSESLLAVIAQGLIKTTDGKRSGYFDLLINSDACRDYIMRGELDEIEDIMGRSAFEGMLTANQSLADLVQKGRVQPEDAIAQSLKPAELSQVLRGRT